MVRKCPVNYPTRLEKRRTVQYDIKLILFLLLFLRTGFFAGVDVTEPTPEEIAGLIEQTNIFYTDLLRRTYGDAIDMFEIDCTSASCICKWCTCYGQS